jgi:hypothetical protein
MKNLMSEEEGQLDLRASVKNSEPGQECGQPGVIRGDELFLSGSANSCESKRTQNLPFSANKNENRLAVW